MKDLNEMPEESKVWVYQSNRPLTESEKEIIQKEGEKFIDSWAAHGADLEATIKVIKDYFIVIALNENKAAATGCSIDKSVQLIKSFGTQFGIDFFNRMAVLFELNNGQLEYIDVHKDALKGIKLFDANLPIYNNASVKTLKDLDQWLRPAKETWLGMHL